MKTDYQDVFNLDGPLARALPGYAYRPEQAAMAKAVGAALARLEPLIVEAGTGTGKTFAYLVPALLSGRSVIISTGTRTCRISCFAAMYRCSPRPWGCRRRSPCSRGAATICAVTGSNSPPNKAPCCRVSAASPACSHACRAGRPRPRPAICRSSPICRSSRRCGPALPRHARTAWGQECPQFARCHVFEARRNAQAADIVVVNHHLLLADLALKDEGFGDLLPGARGGDPGRGASGAGHRGAVLRPVLVGAPGSNSAARPHRRDAAARGCALRQSLPQSRPLESRLEDLRAALPRGARTP